jgi:hypothetical protein
MPGGLHYLIDCRQCGHAIELQIDTLGPEFVTRTGPQGEYVPVALVCRHCKRVGTYDLGDKGKNPSGIQLAALQYDSVWDYAGWLGCEEKTCDIRLPLFAPLARAMSHEQRIEASRSWSWEGLKCSAGHAIREPQSETPEIE